MQLFCVVDRVLLGRAEDERSGTALWRFRVGRRSAATLNIQINGVSFHRGSNWSRPRLHCATAQPSGLQDSCPLDRERRITSKALPCQAIRAAAATPVDHWWSFQSFFSRETAAFRKVEQAGASEEAAAQLLLLRLHELSPAHEPSHAPPNAPKP